jgi:hypothetical protein
MPKNFLSIIIINYKTAGLTINCVNSILSSAGNDNKEIIVVDNASEDVSSEKLEQELGNKIKLIKNKTNAGFGGGNNKGASVARGDFLLFLNSDTIIKEDIFSDCLEIFKRNKDAGIISPGLKINKDSYQPFAFGSFPTLRRLVARSGKKEIKKIKKGDILETDWVSGCALMIRKDLFRKIKGWDEGYFLYYEDVDLCKRVKKEGYKVIVNLRVDLLHLGGKSLGENKKRKKHYYTSQDRYFKKHHHFLTYAGMKIIRKTVGLITKI